MPQRKTPSSLREAVQGCKGCDLWRRGTQAVFGEGDQEDLQAGPAGLKRTLENGFLGIHCLQIEHMRSKPIQFDEQPPMPQIGCLAFVAMVIQ